MGAINLNRPVLYDDWNNERSQYQTARMALLDEDFDELLLKWIAENAGEGATHRGGIPDTAMNPIASNTRQLVTPGLYGRPPKLTYSEAAEPLLGVNGHFERAGVWPRSQTLQYYTVGMGIYFRFCNLVDQGRGTEVIDRLVSPADVVVFTREGNPMDPYAIWHLRCRKLRNPDGKYSTVWVWDQYDIEDLKAPRFTVTRADRQGKPAENLTSAFYPDGVEYDWVDPDGFAFLPWTVYRATDGGQFWPHHRRGMHRGTLRACEHWTYTSRSALFATGEHVFIGGVDPEGLPGTKVKRGDDGIQQSATPQVSMEVTPGMVTFLPTKQGEQITSIQIGPGVNLPNLASFSNMYQMILAVNDGLHPTDATRQSANPTSGAALEISSESRRAYGQQIEPFFLRSDKEFIQKIAWMFARLKTPVHYPVDDVSITYQTLPLSPTERDDLRKDLEWQEAQGMISPVDMYQTLNPGCTREQARKAVVDARIETAKIDAEVQAATGIQPVDPNVDPQNPGAPADPPEPG